MSRLAPVVLVVAVLSAALALPTAAALPKVGLGYSMDAPGTRSLTLHGSVVTYTLHASTVVAAVTSHGRCATFAWNVDRRTVAARGDGCSAVGSTRRAAPLARLQVAGVQAPDRLVVLDTSGARRAWPLPVRTDRRSLQVSRGLATFLARDGSGLWVARLSDGRVAFVAPVAAGDRPVLGSHGVAYHDDLYKHARADRPVLKFVPRSGLQQALDRVGRPLRTGGPIRSFSVDGARVALAVGGGAQGCDRVVFWNVAWRSAAQVSQTTGPTCTTTRARTRISHVVLGGARAQWVATHRGRPMLVAADAIDCQEWVVRRLSDLRRSISFAGMAARGSTIVYALDNGVGARVGGLTGGYRGHDMFRVPTRALQVATDSRRVAVLRADGTIELRSRYGSLLRTIAARGARSIALDAGLLAATAHGRLDVYKVSSGVLLRSWQLPAGAARVQLRYRIAVVTTRRSIHVVDVLSGRSARVATTTTPPTAQVGSVGIVYSYPTRHGGIAKVIPMRVIERAVS